MKKKLVIYFFGNIGTKLISLIMVPLYTSYISPADFGYFDYWLTIINLLIIVISLQLYEGTYTNLLKIKNGNEDNKEVLQNKEVSSIMSIMILQIFLALIIIGICFILEFKFACLSFVIVILNIIFSTLNNGIARGYEENKLMAISGFISALFILTSTLILVKYPELLGIEKVIGLFLGQIIGLSIAIIFLLIILLKKKIINKDSFRINFSLNNAHYKKLLIFSLPLVPNTISWWIMNVSDRFLIIEFLSSAHNGIYAIANKLPALIFMVNAIYNLAWQDEAIKTAKNEAANIVYKKQLMIYVYLQYSFLILFTIFLPLFSPLIIKNDFSEANIYIPLLTLAAVFSGISSFYGTFYFSTGKTKGAFYTSLWGALLNIILNVSLIKYLGLFAPVIGTIAAFLLMLILRGISFQRILSVKFPYKTIIILTSIFLAVYYLIYWW